MEQGINADGSEPIGWLAGIYTLGLFILVGLLLWSFVRTMRRAQQPWLGDSATDREQSSGADQSFPDVPPTGPAHGVTSIPSAAD
ncbi:hypothetical protein [Aeromicrobium sp.]|uniref:hypothetical protein n=1 Tax=Aeromicrobium sp. TaxID=1871063 RepID=UPI0028AB62A6|nr:hypothetical protein [Aeromicrobium sp.]